MKVKKQSQENETKTTRTKVAENIKEMYFHGEKCVFIIYITYQRLFPQIFSSSHLIFTVM